MSVARRPVARGALEIVVYATPERHPRIPARAVTAGIGFCLSLVVHLLIFTGALWGAGSLVSRPPTHLADAESDTPDQDESAMQWMTLDIAEPVEKLAKRAEVSLIDPAMQQLSADALAPLSAVPQLVDDDSDPLPQNTTDDSENRSVLYGRYIGQIDARILRAWLRPRTPIGAPSFTCRARIRQDAVGNVKEVELNGCNGDARWRLSVVRAIQSSSPLPAPPDPKVFRNVVTMSFQSAAYRSGAVADEFEPPGGQISGTTAPRNQGDQMSITPTADGIAIHIVGQKDSGDGHPDAAEPIPPVADVGVSAINP